MNWGRGSKAFGVWTSIYAIIDPTKLSKNVLQRGIVRRVLDRLTRPDDPMIMKHLAPCKFNYLIFFRWFASSCHNIR